MLCWWTLALLPAVTPLGAAFLLSGVALSTAFPDVVIDAVVAQSTRINPRLAGDLQVRAHPPPPSSSGDAFYLRANNFGEWGCIRSFLEVSRQLPSTPLPSSLQNPIFLLPDDQSLTPPRSLSVSPPGIPYTSLAMCHLQSLSWGSMAAGGLVGYSVSGPAVAACGIKASFLLLSLTFGALLLAARILPDERMPSQLQRLGLARLGKSCHLFVRTVRQRAIWRPALFIYLVHVRERKGGDLQDWVVSKFSGERDLYHTSFGSSILEQSFFFFFFFFFFGI